MLQDDDVINYIYKYRDFDDHGNSIHALENQYLYFPKASQINDPFDGKPNFRFGWEDNPTHINEEYIRNIFQEFPENVIQDECRKIRKRKNSHITFDVYENENEHEIYYILSLSKDPLNILLWSYYSNSHRGFCLKFKTTIFQGELCLKFRKYQFKLSLEKHLPKGLLPLYKVYYTENRPEEFDVIREQNKGLVKALSAKFIDWSHEKEYRAIINPFIIDTQKIKYNSSILDGIIIGAKCDKKHQDQLIQINGDIYNNQLNIYKAQVDPTKFKLNIELISKN